MVDVRQENIPCEKGVVLDLIRGEGTEEARGGRDVSVRGQARDSMKGGVLGWPLSSTGENSMVEGYRYFLRDCASGRIVVIPGREFVVVAFARSHAMDLAMVKLVETHEWVGPKG